jgi:hypothetical protein
VQPCRTPTIKKIAQVFRICLLLIALKTESGNPKTVGADCLIPYPGLRQFMPGGDNPQQVISAKPWVLHPRFFVGQLFQAPSSFSVSTQFKEVKQYGKNTRK